MVRVLQPLSESIAVPHKYYVGYNHGTGPQIEVSSVNYFVARAIGFVCRKLLLHVGFIRFFQEVVYDFFLTSRVTAPVILVSTAYVPRLAKKNRKRGGKNIFISGNAKEEFIYRLLINEQKKWGIKFNDAYTFRPRVDRISRFLDMQDLIISQTEVTHNTYEKKDVATRFAFIESHVLPRERSPTITAKRNKDILQFIFVAHIVWLKGLKYLLDAWQMLGRSAAALTIVGDFQPDLLKYFKDLNNPSIKFVGQKNGKELFDIFSISHVCVVPSLIDNHPATIAEAMSFEIPVITTENCGSKNLITEGENGFIVPAGDSLALAAKIRWFCDNSNRIPEMGRNARKSILAVNQECQLEKVVTILNEFC
jgi:glycosyltransferase involved in cell wall biosynthesis